MTKIYNLESILTYFKSFLNKIDYCNRQLDITCPYCLDSILYLIGISKKETKKLRLQNTCGHQAKGKLAMYN